MVYIKKEFSKNTTELFTKTIFHYVPKLLKYIDFSRKIFLFVTTVLLNKNLQFYLKCSLIINDETFCFTPFHHKCQQH